MLLSSSERDFISRGILADLRADGRGRLDYRPFSLSLNPINQAIGSARLKVGFGGDYLVAVRAEVGRPLPEHPKRGTIVCSVDCSSGAEADTQFLVNTLQNIISGSFDCRQLCIVEGKHCWSLFVDVLILEADGNDLDAAVLASRAALEATKLPGVSVEEDAEAESISLSDDPKDSQSLKCLGLPVAVTLCQVHDDSSPSYFVDPTRAEHECARTALTVAVEPLEGKVTFVQKSGSGSLDSSVMLDMLSVAQSTAQTLLSQLSN